MSESAQEKKDRSADKKARSRFDASPAPLIERAFTPEDKPLIHDSRKTSLFGSSRYGSFVVRKKKPTPEEEFEDAGWMLLK